MENKLSIEMVKVGIIDDHIAFTHAMAEIVNNMQGFSAILEAWGGEDLLRKLKVLPGLPDILLMDIAMEGMDGIEATRRVTELYPAIKIVALTILGQDSVVLDMLKAGGCAFLNKSITPIRLEQALREVHQKGKFHADIYSLNANQLASLKEIRESVTEQELLVLQLTAKGASARDMAIIMNVSPSAIDSYRTSLFQKLNVDNRISMIMEAVRLGLIEIEI